jgi:putative tryptophan/tyrosine transport system substrate-binding protein
MNKQNIFFISGCVLAVITAVYWPANMQKKLPLVGVIQVVEHPALDRTREGIKAQLVEDGFVDKKTIQWINESAQGNPALASQIAQKFVGQDAAMVVGIGTTAAQAARQNVLQYGNKQKIIPIVFSSVTDPRDAALVKTDGDPTNDYITGVSNFVPPHPALETFKKILPSMKRIGVIYNPGEANSVKLLTEMEKTCTDLGLEMITVPANRSADVPTAAQQLVGKIDAYFVNNDNTALSAFEAIVRVADAHEIPVFVSDTDLIEQGALAAYGPNQYELGKQTGRMISSILSGQTKPYDIAVEYPYQVDLYLNERVSSKLSVKFSDDIYKAAKKVIR